MNVWISLLHFFFPPCCVVCQERLVGSEEYLCTSCLGLLPRTNYHLQPDNRLEVFFAGRTPFVRVAAYAYFVKGGSIQHIIHELKYKHNPHIGQLIGQLAGDTIQGSPFITDIDILVPVPLHPKREKQRGYNQSLELCKGISISTNTPIDYTTLIRTVNNPSQTKNARFDRWKNVENIFSITHREAFVGKHILLVDDVITTGSTLEACAREILTCEGARVSIFAIGTAN